MLEYSYEDEIFGFLLNESRDEEQSGSEWISTDDGKEDVEDFHLPWFDSSSDEEIVDQSCSFTSDYFFSKTKKWHRKPITNNAGRAAVHNIVRRIPGPTRLAKSQCSQVSDTFIFAIFSSKNHLPVD